MKTSRQRLLEYVLAQRAVSAAEVAQALRMTAANARHHLGILTDQGLVSVTGERPAAGKGRPTLLYGPAPAVQGHNLDGLAAALLAQAQAQLDSWTFTALIEETARRLAGDAAVSGTLTRRLYAAVQRLNALHYAARWEAHADAPRLILAHCPYAAVIEGHPELCQVDATLLEQLSGATVTQLSKLAQDRQGLKVCVFRVGARSSQAGTRRPPTELS